MVKFVRQYIDDWYKKKKSEMENQHPRASYEEVPENQYPDLHPEPDIKLTNPYGEEKVKKYSLESQEQEPDRLAEDVEVPENEVITSENQAIEVMESELDKNRMGTAGTDIPEIVSEGVQDENQYMAGNQMVDSRLENKPFIKLVEECADIMDEFEGLDHLIDNQQVKDMILQFVSRLQGALERSGIERIEDELIYQPVRHQPVPLKITKEGTEILKTLEPGLCIGNRVFRKAKVEVI